MNKRLGYTLAGAITVIIALIMLFIFMPRREENIYTLYIGGYGDAAVRCEFNARVLEFGRTEEIKVPNPSFLVLAGEWLYAVSENDYPVPSAVTGFVTSGSVQMLNDRKDVGAGPCYITCYKGCLFTANYAGGTISVFPTDTSGMIQPSSQHIKPAPVKDGTRWRQSRIHMVKPLKGKISGRDYMLATDAGADRLYFFRLEAVGADSLSASTGNLENGSQLRLYQCDSSFLEVPYGYAPRHIEFSIDGRIMFLLNEKSGRVLVYEVSESEGNIVLKNIQDIEADRAQGKASADIHIHPNGKFLYTSHRKANDGISVFEINGDGTLRKIGYQVTGNGPRHFAITPDGEYMFVCCQGDKKVEVFKINRQNGYLINTGKSLEFNNLSPSCILIQ